MSQPPDLPEIGVRVSLRYLRPPGAQPPMGDVVGHVVQTGPLVQVRSADGTLHEFRHSDVLYVRRLTDRPVKNSAIRSVAHAAALACTGEDHRWLDGWLLRASPGGGTDANSAIPLDMFAHVNTVPAIIDWYTQRGLPPLLAIPERLLRLPEQLPVVHETRTLVCDIGPGTVPDGVILADGAGEGEVTVASIPGIASGRGTITEGSDGIRWLGVSELAVVEDHRRHGYGRRLCAALLAWGAGRGATRAYAQLPTGETGAFAFFEAAGFAGQHRTRYLDARVLGSPSSRVAT